MSMLEVRDLTIKFGGVTALNKVSFSLEQGEVLGCIGPKGSGKTSLFNLLSCIYKPTDGKIILKGENIEGLRPDQIFNRGIARTFQNGRVFSNLSVLENVMMGLRTVRQGSICDAIFGTAGKTAKSRLAIAKALKIMTIFGSLLTEQADKLAKDLPYADRRRLEICRAIASQPAVILLDEPSAGMDSMETVRLMNDLLRVKKALPELTVIVVEHDMTFIRGLVDKVMVLNYGENIAFGTFAEVGSDRKVIDAYLGQEE